MKQNLEKSITCIAIPKGEFCGGNCADCVYWEARNRDANGKGYCSRYGSYYFPSERQGCFSYEKR